MTISDLGTADAAELTRLYRSGAASPVEAAEAAFERIDRFDGEVGAYVHLDREGAMEAARAAEARWQRGAARGPLDGIPVSLKDLTEVAGMPAREGSLLSDPAPCDTDAPPAARLREAGAVFLGKTNTPEQGWKGVTDNRLFGATRNPWDLSRTPGGSSGGAAAAAALNMGVLHQGGDSGGSIRIPAAFTGTFGFKPSFGWVPQWPPAPAATLSHIGPLTRSVGDAAAMLNAMGRPDRRDPYAATGMPEDWSAGIGAGIKGMRVAYSPDLGIATPAPGIADRVARAAAALAALGAEVEEAGPDVGNVIDVFQKLWWTASRDVWLSLDPEGRDRLDPGLAANARAADWTAVELFRAESSRAALTHRIEAFFARFDLLILPTVPIAPFAVNHDVPPQSGLSDWTEWAPYTYPFNLSQQPVASVPCGCDADGMPVGFQIVGAKYDDLRVLGAAAAYLEAHPPQFPDAPRAAA
ncbi:amidase [Roseivivax sp. CAU 1761]